MSKSKPDGVQNLNDEGMIFMPDEKAIDAIPMHYYGTKGQWFFPNGGGGFSRLKDSQASVMLAEYGFSKRKGDISDVGNTKNDRAQMWLIQNHSVAYAGLLAGYSAGLHEINEQPILVTESPRFIEPKNGAFNTIQKFLTSLLRDELHNQYAVFCQWLAESYRAFHFRMHNDSPYPFRHCPMLGIFGDSDCGKSVLIKLIIEPLLGGKRADPTKFLRDPKFNKDLFSASLLVMDDKSAAANLEERRERVGAIKSLIWEEMQRMEGKGADALDLMLNPFWRLVVAGNPGPGYNILPTLDKSLADKMILLNAVRAADLPDTQEQRVAWAKKIAGELPAFAQFLMKFQAGKDSCKDGKWLSRSNTIGFWHPKIASALMELQPEMRLLEMIDTLQLVSMESIGLGGTYDGENGNWHGSASEFEQAMRALDRDAEGHKSGMMDRLFYNGQRAGAMLTELADQTTRVNKTNPGNKSHYRIFRQEQPKE